MKKNIYHYCRLSCSSFWGLAIFIQWFIRN